jgi:hypothetical protein
MPLQARSLSVKPGIQLGEALLHILPQATKLPLKTLLHVQQQMLKVPHDAFIITNAGPLGETVPLLRQEIQAGLVRPG